MAAQVVAVEQVPELAAEAKIRLANEGAANVIVVQAGLVEGAPALAPYNAIIVQGAVEVLPSALVDQLCDGGKVAAIFMEGALGTCRIGYKIDGALNWRFAFNAAAPVLPGFAAEAAFSF